MGGVLRASASATKGSRGNSRAGSSRPTRSSRPAAGPNLVTVDGVLEMQRTAGNQAVSQLLIQREPAALLTADRFKDSAKLRACRANRDRLREGDSDTDATIRIQEALLELPVKTGNNYDLGPKGADGHFGPKTASAIKKFKGDHNLGSTQFGDVGPGTMKTLDELFVSDQPPGPLPIPPGPLPIPPEPKPVDSKVLGPQNPLLAEILEQQVQMHMLLLEEKAEGLLTFDADMDDPEAAKAAPLSLLAECLKMSFDTAVDTSIGAVLKVGMKAIGTKFPGEGLDSEIGNDILKAHIKKAFGEVGPPVGDAVVPTAIKNFGLQAFKDVKAFTDKQLKAFGLQKQDEIKGLAIRSFLRDEYRAVIKSSKDGVATALSPEHKQAMQLMFTSERERVNRFQATQNRPSGGPATPEEVDGIKSYDDPVVQRMDPRVNRAKEELDVLATMKTQAQKQYYDSRLRAWAVATARAGLQEADKRAGNQTPADLPKATNMASLGRAGGLKGQVPGILEATITFDPNKTTEKVTLKRLQIAGLSAAVRKKLAGTAIGNLDVPTRVFGDIQNVPVPVIGPLFGDRHVIDIRRDETKKSPAIVEGNLNGKNWLNRHSVDGPCFSEPPVEREGGFSCLEIGAAKVFETIDPLVIREGGLESTG